MSSKKRINNINSSDSKQKSVDCAQASTSTKLKKNRKHKSKSLVVPLSVNTNDVDVGNHEYTKSADSDDKLENDVRRRFSFRNFGRKSSNRVKSQQIDDRITRSPSKEYASTAVVNPNKEAGRIPTPPPLPKKLLRKFRTNVSMSIYNITQTMLFT